MKNPTNQIRQRKIPMSWGENNASNDKSYRMYMYKTEEWDSIRETTVCKATKPSNITKTRVDEAHYLSVISPPWITYLASSNPSLLPPSSYSV